MTNLSSLPAEGYCRLSQILGNAQAKPPIPPIIPVARSTWYDGIKAGRFPKPVYLGRSALWKVADIRRLLAEIEKGGLPK